MYIDMLLRDSLKKSTDELGYVQSYVRQHNLFAVAIIVDGIEFSVRLEMDQYQRAHSEDRLIQCHILYFKL
jgi:hypothetical protein